MMEGADGEGGVSSPKAPRRAEVSESTHPLKYILRAGSMRVAADRKKRRFLSPHVRRREDVRRIVG